jgi:hypothetical protein
MRERSSAVRNIEALFTHGSVYTLPDGVPVVAMWCHFAEQPQWWFVEQLPDGRLGHPAVTVMPNGSVWNYSLEPDASHPEICIPYPSDLTIEDLRPADAPLPTHVGGVIAAAWLALSVDDIYSTLVGAATTAWQMIA